MDIRKSFIRLAPSIGLPKRVFAAIRRQPAPIRVANEVIESASLAPSAVFDRLGARSGGLTADEAETRLSEFGPNVVAGDSHHSLWILLWHAVRNPLVVLLVVLATISFATGDVRAGTVMSLMVAMGVALRLIQEAKADNAAAKLKAMISVTATAIRDGTTIELPISQLVPGDVIKLSAGDMIPGDVRVVHAKDLFIIQGSLTGESFPVEKFETESAAAGKSPLELANIAFLGTSVESGTATAVVVTTGRRTYLGGMAESLAEQPAETAFDRGVSRFTALMLRFMTVMVPLVFLINGFTKGSWHDAFFFSLAVAVGLTPEMLPMIVSVCLSKGALAMSRKKVVVKRLSAIQNLGAMDVLCTDKTGTLTMDRVILERHCDVFRRDEDTVLVMAYLNSHFQTGLKSVLDRAILDHREVHEQLHVPEYEKVDEIPFDFARKVMSVVVRTPEGGLRLICKGAPEAVYARCDRFVVKNEIYPLRQIYLDDLRQEHDELSADGFRVLAVAYKDLEPKPAYSKEDEKDLVLKGYVAFLDPPKESASAAIAALCQHGISVKVVTGDNELVSKKICKEVGLPVEEVLLGADIDQLSDEQLVEAAHTATLFARVSPAQKQRVIRALQAGGHTVGFMGDGINDAPALRTADVGISVDCAVDIAKESADLILLERSLLVLGEGVLEGRKVFANILKYVRMGASSNFGNMFSVLGASIFVPFLPMTPIQILTNNLLYDISQTAIPTDDVDPDQITKPRPWDIGQIAKFILFIGPCSSIFDYTTYLIMLFVFHCWSPDHASLFQTGWFVESLLTQTLIIHVIRTNKVPFLESRASWPVLVMTVAIMLVGVFIVTTPIGGYLGFTTLPGLYWPLLILTLLAYMVLTQLVKTHLIRRGWL
ncbi:MAG: magnesium-translocating P-type ATPase [Planctomycetes bacterium]|nr:magnesium-translocating P-type ATPase [Planctomycetota bacterium]